MIYLLLFLAAAAILAYVTSRWLRAELHEARGWLAEKWVVSRGGLSQNALIAVTRRAFVAEGLELHFLVASRQTWPCYQRLRRDYMREQPAEPLPAAVVLALAADVDARKLYLRAVAPEPDGPARDVAELLDFDAIGALERVDARLPAGPAPAAEQALEIRLTDEDRPPFHLALEPEWGPSPAELAERIRALIEGRWRPDAPPAIVR